MKEVEIAYPRLRKAWKACDGMIKRLRPPGVKGIPDFVLCHISMKPTFAEVKCVGKEGDNIGIDAIQIDTLRSFRWYGAGAVVIAWCLKNKEWAIFDVERVTVDSKFNDGLSVCSDLFLLGVVRNVGLGHRVCGSHVESSKSAARE